MIGKSEPARNHGTIAMAGTRAMYSSCFGDREAPISVVAFDIADGLIVAIDLIMDPAKTRHLDV